MDGRCQIVQDLYQGGWIQTTPYVILLTQAISATIIIHFAFFGIKRIQMHRDSRFLLQHLHFSALLGSVGCTFLTIYRTAKYINYREHCNLLAPYQVCFLMRLPPSISFMIMGTTILAVVAKDLYFTLRSAKCKLRKNGSAVFVFAVLVQWAAVTIAMTRYWYYQVSEYLLPICLEIQISHYMHNMVIGTIFIDIFSVIVFFVLLFCNRKLKKGCTGGVLFLLIVPHELRGNLRIVKFLIRSSHVPLFMLIAEVTLFILHEVISFYRFYEITLILKVFHQLAVYGMVAMMLIVYGSELCDLKKYINRLFFGSVGVGITDDLRRHHNRSKMKQYLVLRLLP